MAPRSLSSLCVFTGSRPGLGARYLEAAAALGRAVAGRGLTLVYGGSRTGLMGAMADAALEGGARVVGIIPQGLVDREKAHGGLSELVVVPDMHTRKARMAHLADGFLAMPGGFGTLEELFEMITWCQLGLHRKPVGLLDCDGFWDHLRGFIAHARAQGFIYDGGLAELPCEADPGRILDQLAAYYEAEKI
jgi:uncharacterized protein (TIGR00730 family)